MLDHNLDRLLKNYLTEYETATTQEQGWADVLNRPLAKVMAVFAAVPPDVRRRLCPAESRLQIFGAMPQT